MNYTTAIIIVISFKFKLVKFSGVQYFQAETQKYAWRPVVSAYTQLVILLVFDHFVLSYYLLQLMRDGSEEIREKPACTTSLNPIVTRKKVLMLNSGSDVIYEVKDDIIRFYSLLLVQSISKCLTMQMLVKYINI